jgi:hypothetical protein
MQVSNEVLRLNTMDNSALPIRPGSGSFLHASGTYYGSTHPYVMDRDAADQSFVGAVKPVANQVGWRVKLLDRFRHDLANQCPQLQRKRTYHWIVGRKKRLKLAAHVVSFVGK